MIVVAVSLLAVLAIGLLLVIFGTLTKNNWGINVDPVTCPCCNNSLPRIRNPRSLRQALWGGYTCPVCGVEVDKWGRAIDTRFYGPK